MKKTHSIETFRDPKVTITKENDSLTNLTKITVHYGQRDENNQPITPSDNYGEWIAYKEDDTYYVLYWKRAPYEGSDLEIDELNKFNQSIKEKRNIVSKAISLKDSTTWGETIKAFNNLMTSWKNLPYYHMNFEQDIWKEFKEAQSYFFDKLREDHEANKLKKEEIILKAKELSTSDNLKEATKKLQDLLNTWKTIGSAGKDHDDLLWQQFHNINDLFYQRKKEHWDNLKPVYDKAKEEKLALIDEVKAIKDSTSWKETGDKLNELLNKWKKIGFAGKDNDALWKEFDELRQEFYNRRNDYFDNLDTVYKQNYDAKKRIVNKAHKIAHSLDFSYDSTNQLKELQALWKDIGFCGKERETVIWNQFKEELDFYFNNLREYRK